MVRQAAALLLRHRAGCAPRRAACHALMRSRAGGGLAGGRNLLIQQPAEHLTDGIKAGAQRVVVLQAALDEALRIVDDLGTADNAPFKKKAEGQKGSGRAGLNQALRLPCTPLAAAQPPIL